MMKTKPLRLLCCLLAAGLLLIASVSPAGAVSAQLADGDCQYVNPDTGYEIRILDDADLLSADEEQKLIEDMKPITDFGHIMFWSTDSMSFEPEEQAKEKRASYYGRASAGILEINMSNRYITFHSDGKIYELVSESYARSITDNASHYASEQRYYDCAREVYAEAYEVLRGNHIAEPMKYISYTVIALMLAFVIVVGIVFGKRRNPLNRRSKQQAKYYGNGQMLASQPTFKKTGSDLRGWVVALIYILRFALIFSGGGSDSGGKSGSGGGGGSSRF